MTLVHRHIRGAAQMTDREYLDAFINDISPEEWRMLAQLPPVRTVTGLVCLVVALRQAIQEQPPALPADHPLRAAVSA